eukprot:gene26844-20784_t
MVHCAGVGQLPAFWERPHGVRAVRPAPAPEILEASRSLPFVCPPHAAAASHPYT